MLIVRQTQLPQLHQGNTIGDHLLSEIGTIQRVDAIGANDASLDLNMAQRALILPILDCRIVWHPDAGETAEELCLVEEILEVLEQIVREVLDFLLLGFHIVVQEIDF